MVRLLWPQAHVSAPARGLPGRTRRHPGALLPLPSAADPRLLVPADNRRAAAAALRQHGHRAGLADRFRAGGLSLALRSGLAQIVLRGRVDIGEDPGILGQLADVLGQPVLASVQLGRARANRKPVLAIHASDGRLLGYAKVGVSPLTDRLVRAEGAALHRLGTAGLRAVRAPEPLYAGTWHDLPILVQSALPVRPGAVSAARLAAATAEVADLDRVDGVPLRDTPYWSRLGERIAGLPDGPVAVRLSATLTGLHEVARDSALDTGSWHGDWTPWNMSALPDGVAAWDWERFTGGVPRGFDALHHDLHEDLIVRRTDPATAAAGCVTRAPATLRTLGVAADAAVLTALGYLTEIATRYTEDGQAAAGARLGRVEDWLLPTVTMNLGRITR